jgi:hypothetical protein
MPVAPLFKHQGAIFTRSPTLNLVLLVMLLALPTTYNLQSFLVP